MKVNIDDFDEYQGKSVKKITLANDRQVQISLLSQGASWHEFLVPNSATCGNDNLILNFAHTADYYQNPFYLGMSIGRTGGRISKGSFTQGEQLIQLPQNEGANTLHGGPRGFHSYNWSFYTQTKTDSASVTFKNSIKAESDGYPGDLKVAITYTLNNLNQVIIQYHGQAFDQPVLFNPTNHVYFNLTGNADILDHELQLNSHERLSVDQQKLPTGEFKATAGTPFDFSQFKPLASCINDLQDTTEKGLDDVYVVDNEVPAPAAVLRAPAANRQVEIYSARNGLVVFTANSFTADMPLTNGAGRPYQGIALETQTLPDSVHHTNFGNIVLPAHQVVDYQTVYQYSEV
ncbi:galactose mutarotase [Pediococcus acidilactici]|nr:galactose mutarotase [Pediococcus acidilactici]